MLVVERSIDAIALLQDEAIPTLWRPVLMHGLASWLDQPAAVAAWYGDGECGLPLSISTRGERGPWTTSAATMFGAMAVEEASRLPSPLVRAAARVAGPLLSWSARALDPVVNIGTFGTSTYLYAQDDPDVVSSAADASRAAWPKHVAVVRSLDAVRTPNVLRALAADGWLLVPSRKVWYYRTDDPRLMRKRELRLDQRLLDRTPLDRRSLVPADADDIVRLYAQLYLGKYSRWNPALTVHGVREQLHGGGLTGDGFVQEGVLVAVALYIDAPGVMTTPILGYDLALPRALGLYRLLSMVILERARRYGLLLHASAGADEFKCLRGAESALEYVAVDVRGRPTGSAMMWRLYASAIAAMAPRVFGADGLTVSTGRSDAT